MIKHTFILIFFILNTKFLIAEINHKYEESEVILNTKTGNISGTLTIARKPKISPVVLIIAGSGPTDRDGNSALNLKSDAYKMLAIKLAANGISSLRYDKRGIGKSNLALKKESEANFNNYVNDAVEWLKLLKSDKRFSKIIIIGHSEGSLIGILAAKQLNMDGFISLAGAGRSADEIILEQIKNSYPKYVPEAKNILDSLLIGKMVDSIKPEMKSLFRKSVQPYMISWLKYDPSVEIKDLKIPILIIHGTTDVQLPVEDANLLATSTSASTTFSNSVSSTKAKLVIIKNMNHVLKDCDDDIKKNLATYNNPDLPLNKELVTEIVSFINGISNKNN